MDVAATAASGGGGPATTGLAAALGLRGRLLGAILIVAVTTVAVGLFGVQRMGVLSHAASQVYEEGTVPLDQLRELESTWWEYQAANARTSIPGVPPAVTAQNVQSAADAQTRMAELAETLQGAPLGPEARQSFEAYATAAAAFFETGAKIGQASAGNPATLADLIPALQKAEAEATAGLTGATAAQAVFASDTATEAERAYSVARTLTLVIIAVGLAASVVLAMLIVRSVTRPVQRVREVLDQVAGGDLSVRVGETGGAEIGEVARSLDHTLDSLSGVLTLVGDSAGRLEVASGKLTTAADGIADNARTAAGQADVVVASAGDVASSVDTVATGSQQMESAIREISQNATEASRVAGQAVGVAEATTRTVGKLGDSSQEIAAVVKLINGIAEQTNLLALNATIEAARAGEAGKGFAVVASEVKELAQETARATEDISQRVAAIQADTAGAVDAIGQISSVIGEINDFQATIAAAVEEQTATTNEMNRNVGEAANGSRSIATAITGLAAGTQQTNARVADAQLAAAELSRMSGELQEAVRRFTV